MYFGLTLADWFFLAVLVFCSLLGLYRGFVNELIGMLGSLTGGLTAFFLSPAIGLVLRDQYGAKKCGQFAAFLLIYLFFFILFTFTRLYSHKIRENLNIGIIDRMSAFFVGFMKGILLIIILVFILRLSPFYAEEISKFLKGAVLPDLINDLLNYKYLLNQN